MRQLVKDSGAQLFVFGLDNLAGCRFLFNKGVDIMNWILAIIGVLILFGIIRSVRKKQTLEGFAESVAKVMGTGLYLAIKTGNYDLSDENNKLKLYIDVISNRPGYNKEILSEIITKAQELSKALHEEKGLSFTAVVTTVVFREYTISMGKNISEDELYKIVSIVNKNIS